MGKGGKRLYSQKRFIEAIKGSGGIVSKIADRVGCTWHTARSYIDTYPNIKAAYDDERERVLDMAESALIKSVTEQEAWAVKYYLSTIGKQRGYVERQEVTGQNGERFVVNLSWGDDIKTNDD